MTAGLYPGSPIPLTSSVLKRPASSRKQAERSRAIDPGDAVMFTSSLQPKGGVWAEFAAVRGEALIHIPAGLSFIQAAALPVAGGTALEAMNLLNLKPGDSVFMAGASGAIGTLAIQLARSLDCRVATTSRRIMITCAPWARKRQSTIAITTG